ncbi:PAN2-like 3'5' exonuclease [Cryptosporidium canis]|nr:PAN2-like 3'5' exonuclease [Cryptosporidium canis]
MIGGGVSGEGSVLGASSQSGLSFGGGGAGPTSLPNGVDAQTVSRAEEDQSSVGEGLVSIEFDNDTLDFTQPFFMLFSFMPRLSYEILLVHVPGCTSEFCLACELVHLTFMLYSCKHNLKSGKGRNPDLFPCVILNSIYTLNILRTIRHIPEIKHLGIDSEEGQHGQVGAQTAPSGAVANPGGPGYSSMRYGGAGTGSNTPTNWSYEDASSGGIPATTHLPPAAFSQIRKTEIFWRFFLENLRRDMRSARHLSGWWADPEGSLLGTEAGSSRLQDHGIERLVDSLFGIEVTTISSCPPAGPQHDVLPPRAGSVQAGEGGRAVHHPEAEDGEVPAGFELESPSDHCGEELLQGVWDLDGLPARESAKHWSEYGGMSPEEQDEMAKGQSQIHGAVAGVGPGLGHEYLTSAEYSIPMEIRFSKLRKGFSPQSGDHCESSGGIDIIQVDRSSLLVEQQGELPAERGGVEQGSSQDYELVAVIFGVYQGCSVQLPSGTHFCMYVKHKLLFNEMNSLQDKWYMINGSSIHPVANKSEVVNFSSCWKLPSFLFYSDKRGALRNYLFGRYPCLDFQPSLSQEEMSRLVRRASGRERTGVDNDEERRGGGSGGGSDSGSGRVPGGHGAGMEPETSRGLDSDVIEIYGIKFRVPWRYPRPIHDHVLQQLESILRLMKSERNLSEHPDPSQISDQQPFTPEELSVLCLNYFIRYPFSRGLLTRPREICERFLSTGSHSEFINNSPMVVALDSEYVALDVEQFVVRSDGTKEILKKSQLSLARVSIVRCGKISLTGANEDVEINDKKGLIMDHYVSYGSNSQQPRDYLTKYSGVRPGDLDPKTSSHFLTSKSCILKKLQFLVDAGVVFIGHALPSDFKIINIYVPPYQIIDTVEIYRLPDERYISLKFLAKFVLNKNIQTEVHDSIVDAKTALELFLKHLSLKKSGSWNDFLNFLYSRGHSVDWKIEAIESPGPQQH